MFQDTFLDADKSHLHGRCDFDPFLQIFLWVSSMDSDLKS